MPEFIREQHGLVGLRVGYRERSRRAPVLTCALDSPHQMSESWDVPAEEIGLPTMAQRPGQHVDAEVTLGLVGQLIDGAAAVADLRHDGSALWLNLTSEHPLLPALAWENGLHDLGLPVLRLPVHLNPPPPPPRRPRVALWITKPAAKSFYPARAAVLAALNGIREGYGDYPEIHLFTDADLADHLAAAFGDRIIVHDPIREGPHDVDRQPWLAWIERALGEVSFDVLHIIGHGYLSADQGAYACAEAPDRNFDRASARFVWPQQLCTLLASTGTWGLVVSAVTDNYSTAGLRLLATQVAATRAAATVFHDIATADDGALAEAYRLLLHYPTSLPRTTNGLAITAHPAHFGLAEVQPRYQPAQTELSNLVDSGADVSGTLIGAQRQIREWEAQLSFDSSAPRIDSARAGLELAKTRLDAVLRDARNAGEPA